MSRIVLFTILLLCWSCKSTQVEDLAKADIPQITFTSGGGFAGKYTTYVLLENGQIFQQDKMSDPDGSAAIAVGNMPKKEAAQIFSNYNFLNLGDVDQVSYGNYTYSIIKKDGDNMHKLVWEKDQAGAEILQVYYKNVMAAISKEQAKSQIKADQPVEKN